MKNVSKRSAASRKAWRTRKQMKAARDFETPIAYYDQTRQKFIWPKWKQRALPNPWMQ